MDKYIVVKKGSKQYLISEGQEFLIDHSPTEDVLLEPIFYSDGKDIISGKKASNIKLDYKILSSQEKGLKIKVFKYKSKSRYRKTRGFRPTYSKLLLNKISIS